MNQRVTLYLCVCARAQWLQTRLPVQLQVRTVQEVSGEDTGRRVRGQRRQAGFSVSAHSASLSASAHPAAAGPPPSAAAVHHGNVQPVHAVEGVVAEVQAGRVRGEAQVGRVHRGRRVVQDAGRAQHLVVKVVDQGEATVGLHAKQRRAGGAL